MMNLKGIRLKIVDLKDAKEVRKKMNKRKYSMETTLKLTLTSFQKN
jgi:hypothetical protein